MGIDIFLFIHIIYSSPGLWSLRVEKIVAAGDRVYMKFFDLDFFRNEAKKEGFRLVSFKSFDENEFISEIKDAVGLILIDRPLREKHISALDRCRVILALEVGYDFIDLQAATQKGIIVSNVPAYCTDEVATHTMMLLLATSRRLCPLMDSVRTGDWDYNVAKPVYHVRDKKLGIVGFGKIGRALVPKAKGFGIRVFAYDPYLSDDIFRIMGVERVYELHDLLKTCDYISLHVPLTGETYHMISEDELKLMRKEALLINTCRGRVVDEGALLRALKEGWIAGAGLDVLEVEPPAGINTLAELPNVIITPHSAWYSEESLERLKKQGMDEVLRVLKGKRPRYIVNPEVLAGKK